MESDGDSLRAFFWRDEILQIMYWYQGEGFGDEVTAFELRRFLTADAPQLDPHLAQMADDGWVVALRDGRYRLTEMGHREGARRFADAFEDLTKPAHGECSADCDCHRTGDTANCSRRQAHAHTH